MKKHPFFMFFCLLIFSFVNEKAFSGNPDLPKKGSPEIAAIAATTVTIAPPVGTTTLFCTGVPYQFQGNAIPGSVLFYSWYAAPVGNGVIITNNFCSTCNGPTITFPFAGPDTITLIVNFTSGVVDSVKFPLFVVKTPTVSTSPLNPTVCQGGTVGTQINVTGAGNGPFGSGTGGTYTWTPMSNIATVYASGDSILINPPNVGLYTYTVTGTNAAGCPSAPVTVTATVNAPPVIDAYSGLNPGVTVDSICSFKNTSIHMDPSYFVTGTTYTWTCVPNGNIGTPFSQASAVSPVYSGNVDTTFTYYGNLTVPGCPAYPTYTVNVVVVPTPTVHLTSDTAYNCNKMGDSLKVTSNPTVGVDFSWAPNYAISSLTGSGVFVKPTVPMYYYVTPSITVGGNYCPGKRDSVRVLIGDTTNANITAAYYIICKGMTDTLFANPPRTQLNNTYQYFWTLPSTSTGTTSITGDTIVITPTAIGIYTLTVRGTCVKDQTSELLIAVNNCTKPVTTYSVTADTICRRKCVIFTDLTQGYTVRPLFYMWDFTVIQPQISISCLGPGCVIKHDTVWYEATDSAAIPRIKVCYYQNSVLNGNGSFPVHEYITHGLPGLSSQATGYMTVYDGPLAHASPNVTINLGDQTTISGLASSGTLAGIASYTWSPSTALSCTNCASPTASPSVSTQYVLTVIDKNGCTDTSNVTVFVDLFCYDPFVPSAFSPNGDKENDVLYVRSNCLTNFSFKVFDRWGEKVFETADLIHGWDGSFRNEPMNAGGFVYTLEGFLSNGKAVKQKGNITLVK